MLLKFACENPDVFVYMVWCFFVLVYLKDQGENIAIKTSAAVMSNRGVGLMWQGETCLTARQASPCGYGNK